MKIILKKLWAYNDWANRKLIDSMEQQKILLSNNSLHLLSHIMNAQLIWIERIKDKKQSVGVWDVHDLLNCYRLHQDATTQIKEEIDNRQDNLQQIITYRNSKGMYFESKMDDILLHVFNHGTYHRGQIAQDLRINAGSPIATDYIQFVNN